MVCNTTIELVCKLQIYSPSEEQKDLLKDLNYWVNGVIGGSIAVIGFLMNTITIIILRSMPEWKYMMNFLLSVLMITNNIFLITQMVDILFYNFSVKELLIIIPSFVYPMEKTSLTMAVFCTISLAHQAYILTWNNKNHKLRNESLHIQRLRYVFPIIITSALVNLPRWFSYELRSNEKIKTRLKTSFYYIVYYENCVLNILTVFVPITLLVFFNWSVYNFIQEKQREIKKAYSIAQDVITKISKGKDKSKEKKKSDARKKANTKILIIIIVIFIVCHFPRCILKFSDGFPKHIVIKILDLIGRVLLITYSSATPFIYLTTNTRFREHFCDLVNKTCFCRRAKLSEIESFSCNSTENQTTSVKSNQNKY